MSESRNSRICPKCGERKRPKSFKRIRGRALSYFCKQCQWEEGFARYHIRNRILLRMGYRTYKDYLKSPLWSSIRLRVLNRDGRKCKLCGCRANLVHHQRYSPGTLKGDSIKDLLSLCQPCHKEHEFDESGRKVDALQVRHSVNRAFAA